MAKIDVSSIIADVQKLYAKDKKSQEMLSSGKGHNKVFTDKDGVPLPEDNLIRNILNIPCLPYNKIVQYAGNADVGKSTLGYSLVAAAQKSGHVVVLWDSEDKSDMHRIKTQFGGNPDEIILIKTNEILQGGEKVRKVITTVKDKYPESKILFVWDSVGGSQSRAHAEKELDDEKHGSPGTDARENAQIMRMLVALFNKYPDSIAVALANQVYAKIGFMQHGDEESGGKKVKFHSSAIIQLKRIKVLTKVVKGVKTKYGILSRATVTKNHLTQSETSIYQMDFEITGKGIVLTGSSDESDEESDE